MAFDFRSTTVYFPTITGSSFIKHNQKVDFSSTVRRAEAVIKGFDIGYASKDHNVWREKIWISNVHVAEGNSVFFDIEYLYRDSSGNIDDGYCGWVEVVVMAEVA